MSTNPSPSRLQPAIAIACLAACSPTAFAGGGAEAAWQSLHLIDIAQSLHGAASDRCYQEGDPLTRGLIGSHPSPSGVVAWGLGYAAGHFFISRFLREQAPHWAYVAWQSLTISYAGYSVAHNYSIGIRIGRPNTDYPACPKWARP